jgi:hypothetical protein
VAVRSILNLERLYDDIAKAHSPKPLSEIDPKADAIFREARKRSAEGELGGDEILTVQMAMNELRARLATAREQLNSTTIIARQGKSEYAAMAAPRRIVQRRPLQRGV